MSSHARSKKKKKQVKAAPVVKKEPEVVTCKLADNDYTGIITEGQLGAQYLHCPNAKYTWLSGIKYEGPFLQSQIEGKGKFDWQDGSSYTGELHGGKRHGQGLYIAKDGVTRYEGQWYVGERHGEGKLIYNATGTSFYEGSWKAGKKNGDGKQVWPTGNTYVGQWEDGQMRGQGTMTWYCMGQVETYSGNWEASQPHGEGTHTWLAPEPKPDQAFKDTTSQQLNNRYKGQWQNGQRHGKGTFYYANGAYYSGDWQNHVKQGRGRHVFEDGRVYEGPFENDAMTDYKGPEPVGPNFGNDDNPIRRMTDISDIEMFASPVDCRGLGSSSEGKIAPLYVEPQKILREVYNMLLRSLGELKELYYKYRVLLPVQGEDPFVLSAHQFWLFARDCGMITALCPLCRLHRHMFRGPRHHFEVAPEDSEDVKPLTPRPLPEGRQQSTLKIGKLDAFGAASDEASDDASLSEAGGTPEPSEGGSLSSGTGSPTSAGVGGDGRRCSSTPAVVLGVEAMDHHPHHHVPEWKAALADDAAKGSCAAKISKFRRNEEDLCNIHNPTSHMLFRQFVEGIVRTAIARFPHEKTLEVQAHKLFKEKVMPAQKLIFKDKIFESLKSQEERQGFKETLEILRNGEKDESSQKAFDFLADEQFAKPLLEFRPGLLRLFRGGVVEASTECPSLAHPQIHNSAHGIARIRHYGDFGYAWHHYHVCARLDKTIRLKDVLRLFSTIGFLRSLKRGDVPWSDLFQQIFDIGNDDLIGVDEREKEAYFESLETGSTSSDEDDKAFGLGQNAGGGMGGFGGFGANASMGSFGAALTGMGDTEQKEKKRKGSKRDNQSSRKRGAADDERLNSKEESREDAAAKLPPTAALADFATCDFTVTAVQVMRIILEVASPGSVKALRWQLDPVRIGEDQDIISLLEFAENEMIFTEFVRLLIRICDLGTFKDTALCERFSPALRFDGFMRHIFVPALRTPYVPPAAPADETEKASDSASKTEAAEPAADAAQVAASDAGEPAEPKSGEGSAAGEEAPAEIPADDSQEDVLMWPGFDDYACAEQEMWHGLRRWPANYEQEVDAW